MMLSPFQLGVAWQERVPSGLWKKPDVEPTWRDGLWGEVVTRWAEPSLEWQVSILVGGGSGGCRLLPVWNNIGLLAGAHGLFGLLEGKMRGPEMMRDPETLRLSKSILLLILSLFLFSPASQT